MNWLVQNQFFICLDSLCQLETYFALGGDNACIRINAIKGEGHHRRVVTAGRVKFGIDLSQVGKAFELAIEKNKKNCRYQFSYWLFVFRTYSFSRSGIVAFKNCRKIS